MNMDNDDLCEVPRFVVVIVVTHSTTDLELCLDSLEKIDYPRNEFHVVLVDCGIFPDLKDFFHHKIKSYSIQLTAVTLPETETLKPKWLHDWRMNEARNAAMKKVPGRNYIFTEDDCTFEPDWIRKFENNLSDEVGALGGPDYLPDGMGWFPKALECVLDSRLGTLGAKRGNALKEDWYHPRKENMLIPAFVFKKIGYFPEESYFGTELLIARRIREAGLKIKCLSDNHVWHRRVTTIGNLVKRNSYMSSEKVQLLRQKGLFFQSPHFFVLVAVCILAVIGLLSIFTSSAKVLLAFLIAFYILMVAFVAISSFVRMKSLSVVPGVLLLMTLHHFGIVCGTLYGAISRKKAV